MIDRGERRAISEFRSERAPLSLAILFDVSGSMDTADRATAAKFAAHHLINQLEQGRDEAGLFAFDSRLREVAPFSVDTRALKGALGEVDPFGATSLHDAISAAAERVATRPAARRAVVVLTDGIDTASQHDAGASLRESGGHRRALFTSSRWFLPSTIPAPIAPPQAQSGKPLRRLARLKTSRDGRAARCITAPRRHRRTQAARVGR